MIALEESGIFLPKGLLVLVSIKAGRVCSMWSSLIDSFNCASAFVLGSITLSRYEKKC